MSNFEFPENCKIVQGLACTVGAAGALPSDYVSLKNAHRAWAVIQYTDAGGAAVVITPQFDVSVAAANNTASAQLHRMWANEDTGTNDLMVEEDPPAIIYTTDGVISNSLIIIEIDTADMGNLLGVPYDCVRIAPNAVAVGDYWTVWFVIQPRYQSAVINQPSIIID
jgi:hypothetical protein